MKKEGNNKPPRWAMAFFHWFCKPDFQEEIEGDLLERFHKRSKQYGALLLIRDVLFLFRPCLMGNVGRLCLNCLSMMKRLLRNYAEFYLIAVVFLCSYTPPFSISSVSVGIIVLLILQFLFKYKITGNLIGALFILVNWYMFLALMSELKEFTTFTAQALQLLIVGSSIIVFNVIAGGAMLSKYGLNVEIYASCVRNDEKVL